jgi:hypothetical protein
VGGFLVFLVCGEEKHLVTKSNLHFLKFLVKQPRYCGVAPRGRSIERPLLINGYAYLAVLLPDNGPVDSNS